MVSMSWYVRSNWAVTCKHTLELHLESGQRRSFNENAWRLQTQQQNSGKNSIPCPEFEVKANSSSCKSTRRNSEGSSGKLQFLALA